MFVASIAAAVSAAAVAITAGIAAYVAFRVADDRRKESPAKAGLSLQEEPSNVTFAIDEQRTSPAAWITKIRFVHGGELDRAAPTRTMRDDGRHFPMHVDAVAAP